MHIAVVYFEDNEGEDGEAPITVALIRRELNTTALVAANLTVHRLEQRAFTHLVPDATDSDEVKAEGGHVQSVTGAEFWPKRPTQMSWTLKHIQRHTTHPNCMEGGGKGSQWTPCRRGLHAEHHVVEETLISDGFVRASVVNPDTSRARRATPPPEKRSCERHLLVVPDDCFDKTCAIEGVAMHAKACAGMLRAMYRWMTMHCAGIAVARCGPMYNAVGLVADSDVPHAHQALSLVHI